jgi:hypothetical protein
MVLTPWRITSHCVIAVILPSLVISSLYGICGCIPLFLRTCALIEATNRFHGGPSRNLEEFYEDG